MHTVYDKGQKLKFEVYYDERHRILRARLSSEMNKEDIEAFTERVEELFSGKKSRNIICNISSNGNSNYDNDTRRFITEQGVKIRWDKLAIVGADPDVQMVARSIMVVLGKARTTRFCKSEKEALAWIVAGKQSAD